jgi:hypothetical protein
MITLFLRHSSICIYRGELTSVYASWQSTKDRPAAGMVPSIVITGVS